MKLSIFISAVMLSVLSLVSFSANAQTKVSVPCTWTAAGSVPISNPDGRALVDQCLDANGTVATRSKLYTTYGTTPYACNLNSSYSYDGTCYAPSFYAYTTPSCGPNHFVAYNGGNAIFVGQNAPFPTAAVQNFCGTCGFDSRLVSQPGSMPGGMYVITCK